MLLTMAYVLDQAGDSNERARLVLLQTHYDAKTIPKLEQIGVSTGWQCIDVGAGAGSIAQWLAGRVSPSGSVLAVDLDLTLLEPLASATLRVKRHDIRTDDLPGDADLVHARLVLEHLSDPNAALLRMLRALRPGGWILVTDTDFRTVRLSEPDDAFDRVSSAFIENAGWNICLGPQLAAMLERAGLTDVGAECWQTYGRCDTASRLIAMTYRRLRDRLVACGASREDVDRIASRIASGAVGTFSPASWIAWGRVAAR